jgi:polysaccharide biosynthesis transport protein
VRRIRTSIDQRNPSTSRDAGATVVVVTSASQGDGKTTAALALARSYALLGKRTLLIDCDLRQPALHTQLNLTPARGLIDVLTSNQPDQSLARAITKDDKSDLLVLVGSRRSAEATDQLVASRNFDELIRAARHGFDVVVLDTPALGPVVDGLYVSRKADIIVFMAQWAATSRQDIRKALMLLEGAVGKGITIIPVLNRIDQPAAAPYGYASQYHIEPAF